MLLCILGGIAMVAQSRPYTMSVIVTGNLNESGNDIVSSAFMQRLSGNKDYVVFERNKAFLKALTKEQDFQLSGDVPDAEIRAVGKRMGVDYVTVVSVQYVCDGVCYMDARIINLETAQVIKTCSDSRDYEGSETLKAMANMVAYKLYSKNTK